MKWMNWISIAVIASIVFVNLEDLAVFLIGPDVYHFGTEVAGLRYRSKQHFTGWILVVATIGTAAIASGLWVRRWQVVASVRLVTAIVVLAASLGYHTT